LPQPTAPAVASSGAFRLGELTVYRLGFGAMQFTGPGTWGPPADPAECARVLRRAVGLGVNFIDTADCYGPNVSEELIRKALHPYPDGLVIATKGGLSHTGPGSGPLVWGAIGRPEYLRQCCEGSLRRLGLDRIDLFQLHRIDPKVPAEDQFGTLAELIAEGKVRSVGLSEVSAADIEAARAIVPITSVQNQYNLATRKAEGVLEYCQSAGIAFIPWEPMANGKLAESGGILSEVAAAVGATPSQVALAWLLRRSPAILPIPGTKQVAHLEENCAAAQVELTEEQIAALSAVG
jgi:pyridoxine 4-dehydrogenase